MRTFIAGLVLALTGIAPAKAELDLSFGQGGHVTLGFDPIGAPENNSDMAVVACAGPRGSLVVAGYASSNRRVVVAWLDESGQLDARFSGDGKESFPLPDAHIYSRRGHCALDGKLLLTHESAVDSSPNAEANIKVIRIDPASGLADSSFGQAGTLTIDLDDYSTGLGNVENPLRFNNGSNGDLLLNGRYSRGSINDRYSGFVVRIAPAGTVSAVVLLHTHDTSLTNASASGPASDGTIWVAGEHRVNNGPQSVYRARLNAQTLAVIDVPQTGMAVNSIVQSGRMADGQTLILAGANSSSNPMLMVVGASGNRTLQLPVLPAGLRATEISLAPLPDGRWLYATSAYDHTGAFRLGYLARVLLDAQQVPLLDSSFGTQGHLLVQRPMPAGCNGDNDQVLRRVTLWHGRPTLVGSINTSCTPGSLDFDYLITRLGNDSVFRNGFEAL